MYNIKITNKVCKWTEVVLFYTLYYKLLIKIMETFTNKDVEDFSNKIKSFYNKIVPSHLRKEKKSFNKSFNKWVIKMRNKLKF